ncbi:MULTISPECIES: type 1 glutamine amidotransferase domain-containing protein [Maribacter]|uniref:Type 1 glutamine amidotransferase domain-containing protein n=1 Tax=Maribacter flavus TaxID=1658664 RepID=A0ABU7INJ2_9FLAO|nr:MULTISPECIES: type 1 glutamine amidotransferase domain-containing protein [Maribacter]MDC6407094.1 type 1 glutamine amidotransferase domain-containing protein [Maribacter sp. PR66]MEE1974238.1 type 1 glutamine amidotransferase domain-containing protein [Maribacter flavus]
MKKSILSILLLMPILLLSQTIDVQKKVLMVVSSYGKDMGSMRPGYEFDEFSQAYLIFKNNNLSIDVASPKGGKVEPDKYNTEKLYNKMLLEDKHAINLLDNTKATADVKADDYDAIYIVGGKGAMFDLPFDPSLQDIVLNLYERNNTVISSVCHGPAAFVNIKSDGDYIIKDVEITSFCNIEEELFGKKWVKEFPFGLETKLIERGAIFKQTDFMLSKVVVSGKFVTGQNPFSTTRSAEAVVTSLGLVPVDRELYNDERSAYLIQDLLNKNYTIKWAENELAENEVNYDLPLIAAYGYYKILASTENIEGLKQGVALVELTTPYFFNENLQLLLAKTHISLNNKKRAVQIANELISKNLLKEQAEELLKTLG